MQPLPSLNAIRSFEAAGRHLNFTKAAAELGVTQGAVSRLVRQLENDLGVNLLVRRPRGLELTHAGVAYLASISDAFQRITAATRLVVQPRRRDHLAVTMLITFAMRWFMPRLTRFQRAHPQIGVDINSTDRLIDFASEPVDVGIRYGFGSWPGVSADYLMSETVILVASPGLLKKRPIRKAAEIRRHVLIIHSTRPEAWKEWLTLAGVPDVTPRGPALEHLFMSIEAAVDGLGLALVPYFFARSELAAGRLVEPLPSLRVRREKAYYFVHAAGRENEPTIRAFRDWLFAEIDRP